MRSMLLAVGASLALSLPVQAQSSAEEDARRVVELTLSEAVFDALFLTQGPVIASAIENDLRAQGIEISDAPAFTTILIDAMTARFAQRMQEETIPLYVATFTPNELADMRSFYESESGTALLAATPTLAAEGAIVGERIGQELGLELGPLLADRLEAEGIQITTDPATQQRLIDSLR